MRLRANQIIVIVLVLTAGIVGYMLWVALASEKVETSGSKEEDFLRSVRQEAAEDLSTTATEVGAQAPGAPDPSKIPAIKVAEAFDAGTIPNVGLTTRTMTVGNTGNFDLVIMQITTQCPCTVGTMDTKVIPPGAERPMTITLDPRRIAGFTSEKHLTIHSNDPKNGEAPVLVTVKVEPEFSVEPEKVEFGQVAKGQTVTARVIFRQLQDAPFKEKPFDVKYVRLAPANMGLSASVTPRPEADWAVPGHREYALDITFDSSAAPVGPFDAAFTVDTTCARLFSFRVFAHGDVVAANEAVPPENPA